MGVVSAITGLIGAGVSAAGQVEAGQAQAEAYAYQAQVAQNNAAIAQSNAKLDIQAGETAATNQGLKTRAAVGTAAPTKVLPVLTRIRARLLRYKAASANSDTLTP